MFTFHAQHFAAFTLSFIPFAAGGDFLLESGISACRESHLTNAGMGATRSA